MKEEEELKPSRGIVSDVPSDAVEHAKMVHTWAETHPEWKRQHIEDKPKIKNRCGDCAAFRTTFCTWNVDDASLLSQDEACSFFCLPYRPRLLYRPRKPETTTFVRKGENREITEMKQHGVS
ncbi:MAG: hypothetical protein ABR962_07160 [Candidatus Bathyarchaeia archaeon]|jgi:hypothetical protein